MATDNHLDTRQVLNSVYNPGTEKLKTETTITSLDLDGVYDVATNPTPDNLGVIEHERNAAVDKTHQNLRTTGIINGTITAKDIALNDSAGNPITQGQKTKANSLPMTIASDDDIQAKLSAIQTAVEILDDWDSADQCKVDIQNIGQEVKAASVPIVIASDDDIQAKLDAIQASVEILDDWDNADQCKVDVQNIGQTVKASSIPVVIASDDDIQTKLSGIQTAVEILDDWDDGSDQCKTNAQQVQGTNISVNQGTHDAGTQRTSQALDVVSPVSGSLAFGSVAAAYADIIASGTVTADKKTLKINNSTNETVVIGYGSTDLLLIPADGVYVEDLGSNQRKWGSGVALRVKHDGIAPVSGKVWAGLH